LVIYHHILQHKQELRLQLVQIQVAKSPMFDRLVVGTAHGKLYDIGLEVSAVVADGDESSQMKMSMDVWADYHHGPALSATVLCAGEEFMITGGQDGALRVWEAEGENKVVFVKQFTKEVAAPEGKYRLRIRGGWRGVEARIPLDINVLTPMFVTGPRAVPVPLTAVVTMRRQRVLAVGSAGGSVSMFFVEEEPVALIAMYRQRFFRTPVSHLAFTDNDTLLAIASSSASTVHALSCSPDPGAENFHVVASWATASDLPVTAVAWQGTTLLFCDSAGNVYAGNPAETWATAEAVGEPLPPVWQAKLDVSLPVGMVAMPGRSGHFSVVSSTSTILKTYKAVPPNAPGGGMPVVTSTPAHEQAATCVAIALNGKFMATGGADGTVALYALSEAKPKKLDSVALHCGAVLAVHFSRNSSKLYSFGLDGDIFRTLLDGADPEKNTGLKSGFDKAKNQYKWQNINGHSEPKEEPTWSDAALERIAQRRSMQHDTYKTLHRQQLLR
jgi:WD40 repeat protein